MLRQYLSIKEEHPDAILMYRMGDFYEMFYEDAEVASKALEIALTSRNKNEESPVPMCGVPCRAVQGYIARLVEGGHRVAICDQIEDPAKAKGIVKRAVVRVITPGMIVEDGLLDAKENNYVLAVNRVGDRFGLACLDASTGAFRLTESARPDTLTREAQRIDPREVLMPEALQGAPFFADIEAVFSERAVTFLDDEAFAPDRARRRLLETTGTVSLEGFGCDDLTAGVSAAGALVRYLADTQKREIEHITGIETYRLESFLWVDDRSCRNLELLANLQNGSRKGTLIGVIDQTVTAMGGRLLRHWLRYPLMTQEAIARRQDAVAEALERRDGRIRLREALKSVHDLERLRSKVALGQGNPRDLLALKRSIQALPSILEVADGFQAALLRPEEDFAPLFSLADTLESAIRDDAPPTLGEGGIIRRGYDERLDSLLRISRDGKGWLAELEAREKEATGIGALKVRFNKVFGYYIEVPRTRSAEVPDRYVRKQTLVNAERYITDELKDFENQVLTAEERGATLEYELFGELKDRVMAQHARIEAAARYLARLDCLVGFAEAAERFHYCRPVVDASGLIELEDARHPVVERITTPERFVPNSIRMDNDAEQVLLITGPNMAGKSTVLRQVALIVILAQMGAYVPARSARVSLTDRIFTRVGALDNLAQGQSTFLVEMQETADILNNATGRSLVVLDEIGRGTSTFDGLSIAWAVAERLHELRGTGVKTLFATHYHELTELAEILPRIRNHNIAVKEWNDDIIFLRKLVPGGTNRSYGIQVARLAGIPAPVVERAREILADIEDADRSPHPVRRAAGAAKPPGQLQLGLFRHREQEVLDALKGLDVTRMTPMDALNCLSGLVDKAKTL